jgi:hypothetical protein
MNNDQDAAMLKEGTVIGKKTYMRLYEGTTDFWKGRKRGTCKFLSISMRLDPDPNSHSQYGSGSRYRSRTAK